MKRKLFLLLSTSLAFLFFNLSEADAQYSEKKIDYNRIPQKKVRKLLKRMEQYSVADLNGLNSKCYDSQDSSKYLVQTETRLIKDNIVNVWNKMMKINLLEEFSGRLVSLGMMYSKKLNQIFYKDDKFIAIEEGQVFYLNLKLLFGIKNLGVGLEVTNIDKEKRTIKFCYLNNGVTEGTQEIRLSETGEGYSIMTHITKYHSNSKFRDKRLYPGFHRKFVNELHENLIRLVTA
jgi:hypothetical protein